MEDDAADPKDPQPCCQIVIPLVGAAGIRGRDEAEPTQGIGVPFAFRDVDLAIRVGEQRRLQGAQLIRHLALGV
jgi:hypothetical protein